MLDFRFATKADIPLIAGFIRELAEYEGLLDEVRADEPTLREWVFERRAAEVVIAEVDGEPVGYSLFFANFSTFLGRSGLYIEDLYIRPAFRGQGLGRQLFHELARIATERGYGRVEWCCLTENEPGMGFYRHLGATSLDEWTFFRHDPAALAAATAPDVG